MADTEPREWLILNNGCFYRPMWSGYTTRKTEAGRYTEAEARKETAVEPEYISAIHQDDVPDEPAAALARIKEATDAGT